MARPTIDVGRQFPSRPWPVMYARGVPRPRRQRHQKPARGPCAVVMRVSLSTAIPAVRQAAISSSARPKFIRIAAFEPHHAAAGSASEIISALISSWRHDALCPVCRPAFSLLHGRKVENVGQRDRRTKSRRPIAARARRAASISGLPGPAPTRRPSRLAAPLRVSAAH